MIATRWTTTAGGAAGGDAGGAVAGSIEATAARRACGGAQAVDAESQADTARDEIDIAPPVEDRIGLMFSATRHRLLEVRCACGHVSRALPWRASSDAQWVKAGLG